MQFTRTEKRPTGRAPSLPWRLRATTTFLLYKNHNKVTDMQKMVLFHFKYISHLLLQSLHYQYNIIVVIILWVIIIESLNSSFCSLFCTSTSMGGQWWLWRHLGRWHKLLWPHAASRWHELLDRMKARTGGGHRRAPFIHNYVLLNANP